MQLILMQLRSRATLKRSVRSPVKCEHATFVWVCANAIVHRRRRWCRCGLSSAAFLVVVARYSFWSVHDLGYLKEE